jgi:hypothetical protein
VHPDDVIEPDAGVPPERRHGGLRLADLLLRRQRQTREILQAVDGLDPDAGRGELVPVERRALRDVRELRAELVELELLELCRRLRRRHLRNAIAE